MKNNMKIKLKAIFIFLGFGLLSFVGCKGFLDEVPQGNLTQENFPTNDRDALLATNAAYSTLRNWYYNSGGYPILDIMSDDAYKGSNPTDQQSNVGPYDIFAITSSQDGLDRWWNALYEGIRRTNVVIEKLPAITNMNEDLKNNYISQAKFLRALYYFDLVRAWGGVPKITTAEPALKATRATSDEIYDLIISDLKSATTYLKNQSQLQQSDYGRATKGAALSLLAKVYLFRSDWQNAYDFSTQVIKSNEYNLDPDFGHTFSVDGQYNSESIFEIGALGKDGSENGGNQYGNNEGVRGTPNKGWGFNRPSLDLMATFEPNDPRKDATIIFLNEELDGVKILGDGNTPDITYTDASNTVVKEIECYNQKVWVPGTSNADGWGHNKRLIRYADVLLIAAESANKLGIGGESLTYLNTIRLRARQGNNAILPDITTTDQTELNKIILHERRVELALEGHRYWDLIRTGNAPSVLGPSGFVEGKNELLPIPQSEIDISEGTIVQNKNW